MGAGAPVGRAPRATPDFGGYSQRADRPACCHLGPCTGAVYYYWSPVNDNWYRVDVRALSDTTRSTYFPVGAAAPQTPFYTDLTSAGAAA